MKGKAALLVGLATGYVLGTRDGRGRYEQIKTQATKLVQDPRVQQKASQATDLAKDKAPVIKDKLASATSKATSKVPGKGSSESAGTGTTSTTPSSAGTTPRSTGTTTAPAAPSGSGSGSQDTLDDGAIIVTAPPPGPLDPAPTSTDPDSGELHG
jgi:uncharacterized membrane protein